jgi:hypothetical protein
LGNCRGPIYVPVCQYVFITIPIVIIRIFSDKVENF